MAFAVTGNQFALIVIGWKGAISAGTPEGSMLHAGSFLAKRASPFRPQIRLSFSSPAACFRSLDRYAIGQMIDDMERYVADHSGNVIDFGAYRARRLAASGSTGVPTHDHLYQNAFYCFWPMMVWMPVPVFVTPLANRDAL